MDQREEVAQRALYARGDLTKEQVRVLAGLGLDDRYEINVNEAERAEAITADGRVAIVDIDGEIEYEPAAGWRPRDLARDEL